MYAHLVDARGKRGDLFTVAALLFLAFGGYIKGSRYLAWVPIDPTLVALVVVAGLVVQRFVSGAARPRRVSWLLALAGACTIGLLPAGITNANTYAAQKPLHVFLITPVCLLGGAYLLRGRARSYWCSAVVLLGLVSLLFSRLDPSADIGERLATAGGSTIGAGRATGAALVVLALALVFRRGNRAILAVGVAVAGWGAIAAASRGPVLAALVAVFVAVIALRQSGRALRLLMLITGGSAVAAWIVHRNILNSRLTTVADDSATIRTYLWRQAWDSIQTHPLGFGWGRAYDQADIAVLDSGYVQYPHNVFLEVASEAGWLAGALLVGSVLVALRHQWLQA